MRKTYLFLGIAAAAMLFASPALAQSQEKMVVNLCTGGPGKPYDMTGNYIGDFLKGSKNMELRVINTNGTWDNIERTVMTPATPENVASGAACHAFIGQPDGAVILKRKNLAAAQKLKVVGEGPREFLHVLCSKESGVDDLSDLAGNKNYSVALGNEGSGAWLIWQNFVEQDKSYGDVTVSPDSGVIALASIQNNDLTCTLIPAALGNADVVAADEDFGGDVVLVGANDKDFNDAVDIDGRPLYRWQEIPSKTYKKNLQNGWFTSSDTITWKAKIYVNKDYFSGNQKALADFISAIAKAKPGIRNTFGDLD